MLIAELRRKLMDLDDIVADDRGVVAQVRTLLSETKEDLLTADVFGLVKYLPRQYYLDAVLTAIAACNPEAREYGQHLPKLQEVGTHLKFTFWPTYATPEGLGGTWTEPDVELSDSSTLILVEAKLWSGFGKQQVERELAVALAQAEGRECFVVLVTPGNRPPRFGCDHGRLVFRDYLHRSIAVGNITNPPGR